VLVSCDLVFSGLRPSGECWQEDDSAEPAGALGRALLAREHLTQRHHGSWLITRPADVYGLNLSIPAAASQPSASGRGVGTGTPGAPRGERADAAGGLGLPVSGGLGLPANGNGAGAVKLPAGLPAPVPPAGTRSADALARERHVWERSGLPLRWVAWLRAGQSLAAPAGIRRSPTYAWDYAQRVCELIAQECEGVYNTAGPTVLGRLAHLRLLARAFECDLHLVRDGSPAALERAGGEPGGWDQHPPLPANTALCDHKSSFVLGRPATDPFTGHRLMRRELERLLGCLGGVDPDPPSLPSRAAPAVPVGRPSTPVSPEREPAQARESQPARTALG
jgi:RmlD substrate binding domain